LQESDNPVGNGGIEINKTEQAAIDEVKPIREPKR